MTSIAFAIIPKRSCLSILKHFSEDLHKRYSYARSLSHCARRSVSGPINGPIQAAIFGWVPVLLWVLVGGIFIEAVQDFSSIYASVRNKGRSTGYIIELYVGKLGKRLFLLFVWLFSILVVAAFADIVAGTFNGDNADFSSNLINGATATTNVAFIAVAVGLGFFIRYRKPTNLVTSVVAILALVVCIAFGLALCAIAIFLKKTSKKGSMIWIPIVFMLGVTFTALFQIIIVRFGRLSSGNFVLLTDGMQLVFALLLVGLGLVIAIKSIHTLFFEKDQ